MSKPKIDLTYKVPDLDLNEQFQKAQDIVLNTTKNLFITGKAGTGKSTLLNLIRLQTEKNTTVLAPTGLAALNVGGQTIHSFFKISPKANYVEAKEVGEKRQKDKVIQNLQLLIIDEISMVRADLLDCIDTLLRHARKNNYPFGGVQTVFIGDLYQLPPVLRTEDEFEFKQAYHSPYFFASKVMEELFKGDIFDQNSSLEVIELHKIYRQSDLEFIDILNSIRHGVKDINVLNKLNVRVNIKQHPTNAIILTTTNVVSDDINKRNLDIINEDSEFYGGEIEGEFNTRDLPTSLELELKPGARVMFVKNDQKGRWVNGTLGTIKELYEDGVEVISDDGKVLEVFPEAWEVYRTIFNQEENRLEQEVVGRFTQLPLKLAWAITIHKSQGQTFDQVILDLRHRAFTAGQTYVALSRCRSLDGLYLTTEIKPTDIRTDLTVVEFLDNFTQKFKLDTKS